ncbi:hypothetical protein F4776DRAFT_616818 [Hypoxylon sp. NC0597]|nr:hypothetical protein F4776DRAFT_616818 [Hypoxylon sp. NC0597]
MAYHQLPRSNLNPAAPSWLPGGHTHENPNPDLVFFPDEFIVIDAYILGWHQVVRRPLPGPAIANATNELLAGLGIGNRVFNIQELRNIYGTYARNASRRFDLSEALEPVMLSRGYAYNQLLGGVENLRQLRPLEVVQLVDYIHHLNDLVKRILLAEHSGVFMQTFRYHSEVVPWLLYNMPQGTEVFGGYLNDSFSDYVDTLESDVVRLLSHLHNVIAM